MRMPHVRFTLRRMMVAVAMIALICSVVTITRGAGILLIGLALAVGGYCWSGAKDKRFWLGFEVAGLAAVLAYIGYVEAGGPIAVFTGAIRVLDLLPLGSLVVYNPLSARDVIFEASYGLPMLLIASVGGVLATLILRVGPTTRIAHVWIKICWLAAAVVALALIWWQELEYVRSHAPPPSIRVFNKTDTPLDHIRLRYENLGPQPSTTPLVGGTLAAPGVLEPGGTISWLESFFDRTGFTFSCTSPDGTVKTARAVVNISEDPPTAVDFYVEPAGVRAVIVPRPWWLR
jgi:hypothetical protein